MIRLEGISKSFAGVPALSGVSLEARAGTVHGLLGENGAGKSTLMNILFGLLQPDAGTIAVAGTAVRIASPRAAQRLGIGMVHQHFKLVPTLSVLDNLALALMPGLGVVPRAALAQRIAALAGSLGWRVDAAERIERLSVGQQQRVEILKALAMGGGLAGAAAAPPRALILDEPTAVLAPQEVDELIPALRRLAAAGSAVILISHKLAEVERACDEVSVLRRGRLVHSGPLAGLSRDQLAHHLVGAPVELPARQSRPAPAEAPTGIVFDRVGVTSARAAAGGGAPRLEDVSLTVRAGEIVGIAGVDGNGQGPLAEVALGLLAPDTGRVAVAAPLRRLGVIPEDRHGQALVLPLTVTENLLLKDHREPRFSAVPWLLGGWLRLRAWRDHARALVERYDVRIAGLDQRVEALSGGNQQKLVVARELHDHPRVIVAVNPTRGLDLGATAAVLGRLVAARDAGAAVLLIHSDLDELLAVADRVLVLYAGRLTASAWPQTDRAAIGRLMLGLPEAA
jgi:simple sugar transport system ATP-binding protein